MQLREIDLDRQSAKTRLAETEIEVKNARQEAIALRQEMARLVAAGAGLTEEEIHIVTLVNPQALVQRALNRYAPMVRWSRSQMVGWSEETPDHQTKDHPTT